MKLFEIISTKTTTSRIKNPHDMDDLRKKSSKRFGKPGVGSFAYGQDDKKDPHMFDKKYSFPSKMELDPYDKYVKAIQPYMDSNPFFPRIYNKKIQKDPEGVARPEYKAEKLQPASNFSIEALFSLGKQLFKNVNESALYSTPATTIALNVWEAIDSPAGRKNIKDPKLLEAIKVIIKILKSDDDFLNDVTAENIMFRGTPHGPQLVLMDPIFDGMKKGQIR